ncbi:hypothetical protein FB45DRAFT_1067676 [Roridomyces roridus]|uniref:F-box domain-containing protein n=1 Tax=Roridomyces roridus TaxID=1738132 RepID=A0AAD7B1N7_9AGAR|nr:hypothetical protein FB45DRAFT_1067676 [Roridomyces roridus]
MSPVLELRQRIELLSTIILRQRDLLRGLEDQLSTAQSELNSTLDPMARLPFEISSDILLRSSCTTWEMLSMPTRVSRAWRNIALGTPAFWTTISDEGVAPAKFPELLQIWLRRGSSSLIFLSLRHLRAETFDATFATLSEHRHRVETLDLHVGPMEQFQLKHYPLVALKSLTLSAVDGIPFSLNWVHQLFSTSPHLVEFNLLHPKFLASSWMPTPLTLPA